MNEKMDNYNPDYSYKKNSVNTGKSRKGYPIIERTNNALLFPEAPKNSLDLNDIKD